MSALVIDASAAAKWYFPEEHSDSARSLLSSGHDLHAPDFLLVEVSNVLWKRCRRGEITPNGAAKIRKALAAAGLRLFPAVELVEPASEIALQAGCTVYDALYVALAITLDARLVTADRRLVDLISTAQYAPHVCWIGDSL